MTTYPGPYGTRRVDITAMARDRMTAAERVEVQNTCRDRGFRLSLMWSLRERAYSCVLTAGSKSYLGVAATPMEAWHRALALRDVPIVSVLTGPES